MIKNLALSGGSVKGLTYLGLVKFLEENPEIYHNLESISGASIGSIFATYLCLQIPYKHLSSFLHKNMGDFLSFDIEHLFEDFGLDKCEHLINFIGELMGIYKDLTFKELYNRSKKKLIISATCLSTYSTEYFNYETHPDLKVLDAIRASISLPFLFTKVDINGKIYVDGGILEPLPIRMFDKKDTLGLWICDKSSENYGYNGDFSTLQGFIYNFFVCVKRNIDILTKTEDNYDILKIELQDISVIDFDLTIEKKQELIDVCYNTLKNFFTKK